MERTWERYLREGFVWGWVPCNEKQFKVCFALLFVKIFFNLYNCYRATRLELVSGLDIVYHRKSQIRTHSEFKCKVKLSLQADMEPIKVPLIFALVPSYHKN